MNLEEQVALMPKALSIPSKDVGGRANAKVVGHARQRSDISDATASTWSGWDSIAEGVCWADACDEVDSLCEEIRNQDLTEHDPMPAEPAAEPLSRQKAKSRSQKPLVKADNPEDASLPSVGSRFHDSGRCKPCAFFHTKGCVSGSACLFCHLCPPREVQRRKQLQRHLCQKLQMQMRGKSGMMQQQEHRQQHEHQQAQFSAPAGPGYYVPVMMTVAQQCHMQEGMGGGYMHQLPYWQTPGVALMPVQSGPEEW
mmetsp:Transcript_43218/g.78640  ORF Transcript_43218/g.78640 Transcript_43218/m.78640 type:complete len:254 (+) Transcript_43218:117-878(+)